MFYNIVNTDHLINSSVWHISLVKKLWLWLRFWTSVKKDGAVLVQVGVERSHSVSEWTPKQKKKIFPN